MKKIILQIMVVLIIGGISLWGCSSDTEAESEKGAIRQMTDQVAKDMVHRIKSPINRARDIKNREENRFDDMDEAAEESSRID
jgi:hypothetical protein